MLQSNLFCPLHQSLFILSIYFKHVYTRSSFVKELIVSKCRSANTFARSSDMIVVRRTLNNMLMCTFPTTTKKSKCEWKLNILIRGKPKELSAISLPPGLVWIRKFCYGVYPFSANATYSCFAEWDRLVVRLNLIRNDIDWITNCRLDFVRRRWLLPLLPLRLHRHYYCYGSITLTIIEMIIKAMNVIVNLITWCTEMSY